MNAAPVKIVPELDETGRPIDLSLSMLRFVSSIHIEYLKNMGVEASLSISILVESELWSLFACHHYSPRCPSFQSRSVSELFAQMFAMRLESRQRREVVEYERRARDISDQLLGAVASDETLKDPHWLADILTNAIPADGVGVWITATTPSQARPADRGFSAYCPSPERRGGGEGFCNGPCLHPGQGWRQACGDMRRSSGDPDIALAEGLRHPVQV